MARNEIPVVAASKDGTVLPTGEAADVVNGNYVLNSGRTILIVHNSSGTTAYDLTVHVQKEVDGKNVEERVNEIAFGVREVFGPYPTEDYGDELWINGENAALLIQAIEP